jgi:hypothetical protein
VHHLVQESGLKQDCIYCGKNLDNHKWESVFHAHFHYKTTKCTCGKKVRVKVDFCGSGHDSWDGTHSWKKKIRSTDEKLESKIKVLERIKILERVDSYKK